MGNNLFSPYPVIVTGRLKLRLVRRSDAAQLFDHCHRKETSEYAMWYPHESLKETHRYILWKLSQYRKGKCHSFIVEELSTGNLVGTCSYVSFENSDKVAEIGYSIVSSRWGEGFATEVAKALVKYGFEKLNLQRIYGRVVTDNVRSAKVLENAGMKCEGVHRKEYFFNGKSADLAIYAITDDDYTERSNKNEENSKF